MSESSHTIKCSSEINFALQTDLVKFYGSADENWCKLCFSAVDGFSHLTNSMFLPQISCRPYCQSEDAGSWVLAMLLALATLGSCWAAPGGRWAAWPENSKDRCPKTILKHAGHLVIEWFFCLMALPGLNLEGLTCLWMQTFCFCLPWCIADSLKQSLCKGKSERKPLHALLRKASSP